MSPLSRPMARCSITKTLVLRAFRVIPTESYSGPSEGTVLLPIGPAGLLGRRRKRNLLR